MPSEHSCRRKSTARAWRQFLLLLLPLLSISAAELIAQNWRISGGYTLQRYGLDYIENSDFDGGFNFTQKGLLELEVEQYLLYRLYVAGRFDYLVNNQESIFMDGPINFRQANTGAVMGMQWSRLGLFGGVKAGRMWNLRFRAMDADGNRTWVAPEEPAGRWTTALTGGVNYYLLRYVRLQARVTKNFNMPESVVPGNRPGAIPAVNSLSFHPYTISIGLSVGIPWRSNKRLDRVRDSGRLPALMEMRSVRFRSPVRRNTYVTSAFGQRWQSRHEGVDLHAGRGEAVVAAAPGVVLEARTAGEYGRMVRIQHSRGYTTTYAHLHRIRVRQGQTVSRGQLIGAAGSSGNASGVHLHFEIHRNGNPVDPLNYIIF